MRTLGFTFSLFYVHRLSYHTASHTIQHYIKCSFYFGSLLVSSLIKLFQYLEASLSSKRMQTEVAFMSEKLPSPHGVTPFSSRHLLL